MLVMGFLVFLKQHLLDRELIQLLQESHQTLEEMRGLKDDLVKKESLLSWQSMELQRKNLELQEASYTDALTDCGIAASWKTLLQPRLGKYCAAINALIRLGKVTFNVGTSSF
jgi:hypothetical protein